MQCSAILVSSFLETGMIEMLHQDEHGISSQIAPAFYHTYAYVNGKKIGMIKPNKFLAKRFSEIPVIGRGINTKLSPMLVPPKNWTSWDNGGYWYTREEVMRTRQSMEQKAYLKEASDADALGEVYRGLDILGQTCWTINKKVFKTVLKVWNSGEPIADIPAPAAVLEYPIEPKAAAWDVKARMNWIQECRTMSRVMQNSHSLRCDLNYKLDIAHAVCLLLFALIVVSGEEIIFPA
jgi:DNA-directed RNA polymerase, mitochondrial